MKELFMISFVVLAVISAVLAVYIRHLKAKYIQDPQDRYLRAIKLCTVFSILIFCMMIVITASIFVTFNL